MPDSDPSPRAWLAVRAAPEYAIAAGLVLAAAVISAGAATALEAAASFFPFVLAVAVAAVRGGALVGAGATALSAVIAAFFFFAPVNSPLLSSRADQAALTLFVIEGLAISGLGEFIRRGRVRMERSAEESAALLDRERVARTDAERATSRSTGLQATAAALGRALGTDEVADVAVREGLARLGAGRGVAGVLESDGHTIRTAAAVGFANDIVGEWPTFDINDDAPLSEAMRIREPMIVASADELATRYPRFASTAAPGGPAVVVPLT